MGVSGAPEAAMVVPMSTPHQTRTTHAFHLQAGISFGIALLTMVLAIIYLPVDPWIRAFPGVGTLLPHDLGLHPRHVRA